MFTTSTEHLLELIKDTELCNVYEEYLVTHLAWENFGFWYEVQNFKTEPDEAQRKHKARMIFAKFLEPGSIFELGDLDQETNDIISSCLEKPPLNLFDILQRRAFDTLARATLHNFLNDKLYLFYKKHSGSKVGMLN